MGVKFFKRSGLIVTIAMLLVASGCARNPPRPAAPAVASDSRATSPADRPGCNDTSRKGGLALFRRFRAAYRCMGFSPFDLSFLNWRLQRWGYGCYTSERNLGLNVNPVDDIDWCGRNHDIAWHAICQNHPELDRDEGNDRSTGCDCYHHTPWLTCDRSGAQPVLELPELSGQSSKCERLCGQELIIQATCFAKHITPEHQPARQFRTPWTCSSGPACIPSYCNNLSLTDERYFISEEFGRVVPPPCYDRPQNIPPCPEPDESGDPPRRP